MSYEHYSDDELIEAFRNEVQLPIQQQQQDGAIILEVMYRSYVEVSSAVYSAMILQYNRMYMNWLLSVPGIHDVQQMHEIEPSELLVDVYMRMRRRLMGLDRPTFFDKFHGHLRYFFAYKRMVIHSVVIDYLRSGPPLTTTNLPDDLPDPDFDDPLHSSLMQSCADQLLSQCSPEEKRLLILRILFGYPPRLIREFLEFAHLSAEEIGRQLAALYNRLRRNGNIDPECLSLL